MDIASECAEQYAKSALSTKFCIFASVKPGDSKKWTIRQYPLLSLVPFLSPGLVEILYAPF